MPNVGDLVNNVEVADYNYGMVLESPISITEALLDSGADLGDLGELGVNDTEPPGARVLWDCGTINVHYYDELEVIGEIPKPLE